MKTKIHNKNAKTKHLVLGILIVLLVALILILILIPGNQTGKAVKDSKPVKIGAILALSGKSAYYGEYAQRGLEIAKDEINANGGINGRQIQILYEDSKAETEEGVKVYQKLAYVDQVHLFLTSLSNVVVGIAPLAEKDHLINFAIGTAAPTITTAGDYTFRHNILPQEEMKVITSYVYNRGVRKVAILYAKSESGISYSDEFEKDFVALGGETKKYGYDKGAMDFRTILTKVKETGIKDIFLAAYPDDAGRIMVQAKELGLEDMQYYSGYPSESPKLIELGGSAADGMIYTTFLDSQSQDPGFLKFKAEHIKRYNVEPEIYAVLAYDNVRILVETMSHCKDPEDAVCVKEQLYRIKDFQTITGKVTMDENGDTRKEVIIKTVKDGKFVLLKTSISNF